MPNPTGIVAFLRRELAARPGRVAVVIRVSFCCTLIITIWMVFRIPEPAYAVYIVFLVGCAADSGSSLRTAVGGFLAATFGIGLSLLFYSFDASEPALRLPLMVVSVFLGMFLSRTIVLGSLAFLLGYILVITQTLADILPTGEAITRFLLWLWLVVALPATVTALVSLGFTPRPRRSFAVSAGVLLAMIAEQIRSPAERNRESKAMWTTALCTLRECAAETDGQLAGTGAADSELFATMQALATVSQALTHDIPEAARYPLESTCVVCREALESGSALRTMSPWANKETLQQLNPYSLPIVVSIAALLDRLEAALNVRSAITSGVVQGSPSTMQPKRLFVADAFGNPQHVRFALKATLAAMSTYLLYTGLNWPGIRTCMITCFFVAMNTTGETVHKLSLRLIGASVGGLLGSLCIVYALPSLDDIGQLALLVMLVSGLCAWVSASSALLSYAGMQMALAFFLGVLQGDGPTTDLTVLRDRVVGIIVGNIVMSIVFSALWPVTTNTQLRNVMSTTLADIVTLLRAKATTSLNGSLSGITLALEQARRLIQLAPFDSHITRHRPLDVSRIDAPVIDALEDLAYAAVVVANQPSIDVAYVRSDSEERVSSWLARVSKQLQSDQPKTLNISAYSAIAAGPPQSPDTLPIYAQANKDAQQLLSQCASRFSAYVA